MAMSMALETDTACVANILKECFGHAGDFTVVVEEQVEGEGASDVKQTEFQVWSPLLTRWSPVFDRMIQSEGFMERQQARMVINDFSGKAVEAFLRFLYSGVLQGSLVELVEVSALADKYQVTRLQELCSRAFEKGLGPENACQLFAAAARFQLPDLRRSAKEMIWIKAKEALKSCPNLSPDLLEEILEPGLLCISNSELEVLMNGWRDSGDSGRKRKAGEDLTLLQAVFQRQKQRIAEERGYLIAYHGQPYENDTIYSEDIFRSLWTMRRPGAPFLGREVNVVLGRERYHMNDVSLALLESLAANIKPVRMSTGSLSWMLLHRSVYLTGVSFDMDLPEEVRCQVYCSEDGSSWHLAADSGDAKIEAEKPLRLHQSSGLVKWFKLEVEGIFFNRLRFRGIIKDDLH